MFVLHERKKNICLLILMVSKHIKTIYFGVNCPFKALMIQVRSEPDRQLSWQQYCLATFPLTTTKTKFSQFTWFDGLNSNRLPKVADHGVRVSVRQPADRCPVHFQ